MTNLLVVCNDAELRKVIRAAVDELPLKITKEVFGAKGVTEAMMESAAPLVIVDLFIPGTNGLEIMKILKKVNESATFLLITRLSTRSAIDKAFRFGAQDVLVYPFTTDSLRQTLAHRLELMVKPGTMP
ncbi:MAG: response regulator [Bacteriovoracia bacterium]